MVDLAQHPRPLRAAILSLAGALCFACGALSFRFAAVDIGSGLLAVLQVFFWERVFGLALLALSPGRVSLKNWRGNLGAGALCSAGSLLYYFSLTAAALAVAVTLTDSHGVLAVVFAAVLVRRRPGGLSVAALLLAFVGAVLCAGPFGAGATSAAGVGASLAAACAFAGTALWQRHLTAKGSRLKDILFFMYVCAAAPVGLLLAVKGQLLVSPTVLAFAAGVAVFNLLANAAIVTAQRYGSVALVGSLVYAAGLFGAVLGWLAFDEVLQTSTLVGIALIIAGGAGTTWAENRQQQTSAAARASALSTQTNG